MRAYIVLVVTAFGATAQGQDSPQLRERGYSVLQTFCINCHGDKFNEPGLDMRDRATLIKPKDASVKPFLVPGKLADSRIWEEVDSGHMPPDDQPQPSADDKAALKAWILAGAEFPQAVRPRRAFVGERTLLATIAADLQQQPANKRNQQRYLSLAHLWNNPEISDEQLRIVRAGVSKLLNSLSSQPRIVVPELIGNDSLVMRIDLRDYGWTHQHHWLALLAQYPYGLAVGGDEAAHVYELTQCDLPYLRADWFVHQAARPPLYHALVTLPDFVGIPDRLGVLERLLGVDVRANFESDKLWRAAFSGQKSGVSDHNRMVERHDSKYGYYWPSYDSAGDSARQNFFNFPLGPAFPGRQNLAAFNHDGGEMIFSLPNHLQAYMLAKSDGTRISVGPQAIVSDPQRFSGTYDIVTGISCMGCHRHGMEKFTDTLREQYVGRSGAIADKVLRLFPEKEKMDVLVAHDEQQFLNALEQTIGPLMRTGTDDRTDIKKFPEPITAVAKLYDGELKLDAIACELGLPDRPQDAASAGIKATVNEFATAIKLSARLAQLELTPLMAGEPITRQQWEKSFQRTALELGIGTPIDVR